MSDAWADWKNNNNNYKKGSAPWHIICTTTFGGCQSGGPEVCTYLHSTARSVDLGAEDIHGGDSQATASVSDGVLLLAPLNYRRERKANVIRNIQNKLQGKRDLQHRDGAARRSTIGIKLTASKETDRPLSSDSWNHSHSSFGFAGWMHKITASNPRSSSTFKVPRRNRSCPRTPRSAPCSPQLLGWWRAENWTLKIEAVSSEQKDRIYNII